MTTNDPRQTRLRIQLGERYGIPAEEEIPFERLERFAELEARRAVKRERRDDRAASWKLARQRGAFAHTESTGTLRRILDGAARKLGLDPERIIVTVDRHANTSAASIPLALAAGCAEGRIKKGDLVLLEAMGGGFTWGAVLLRW